MRRCRCEVDDGVDVHREHVTVVSRPGRHAVLLGDAADAPRIATAQDRDLGRAGESVRLGKIVALRHIADPDDTEPKRRHAVDRFAAAVGPPVLGRPPPWPVPTRRTSRSLSRWDSSWKRTRSPRYRTRKYSTGWPESAKAVPSTLSSGSPTAMPSLPASADVLRASPMTLSALVTMVPY